MRDFLLNKMRTGRPPLLEAEKKAQITGVRLRPEERTLLERAASKLDQNLSEWMRNVLVETASKQLKSIPNKPS